MPDRVLVQRIYPIYAYHEIHEPVVPTLICASPFRKLLLEKLRLLSAEWLLRNSLATLFLIHGLEACLG